MPAEDRPPAAAPDLSAGAEALAEAGAELGRETSDGDVNGEPTGPPAPAVADPSVPQVDCPLCGTAGALSLAPVVSPRYMRCPECQGHGLVLSGSLVDEAILLPCESCSGRGYVANPDYNAEQARSIGVRYPTPEPPNPPAPGMEWDPNLGMWGYPPSRPAAAAWT